MTLLSFDPIREAARQRRKHWGASSAARPRQQRGRTLLAVLRETAADPTRNLMAPLNEAARGHGSGGEMVSALK